jgi:rsbT co-antagonist protein RsbR
MSTPPFETSVIADSVVAALLARTSRIFNHVGEEVCRGHVDAMLAALERDLAAGKPQAIRAAARALVEDLAGRGLTFSDLRFFVQTFRDSVREVLSSAELEDWLFELVQLCTMRFIVAREDQLQQRSVKLELSRLESQLSDLTAALEEKTRLLEVIRQASTPIVPVVRGIHVVPLVGMFDSFRARVLTEKLLNEVARVHARVVILDISGVPVFDTDVAQLIIRLARAVRLLGTEIFMVGMSAQNARTIVELGVDLSGLQTFGTLQDGVAQALVLQGLRIRAADQP